MTTFDQTDRGGTESGWNGIGPCATAGEQVSQWDAGKSIWSLEMGGLGPGYEQAIQILAIEITRDNLGKPLPETESDQRSFGDATVTRIDAKDANGKPSCGGFSGAQVGAAKWLAYKWLSIGPAKLLEDPNADDRRIQVSQFWPHVLETAHVSA
jgi:hypothetical protein